MNPSVSLVVCTMNRAEQLARSALSGIVAAASLGFEVCVVDQSETDATARLIEGIAGVHLVRSEPGLSRARNVGIRSTTSSLIAFTDDDVAFPAGWMAAIAGAFDDAGEIGMVCGRAVRSSGALMPGAVTGCYVWPSNPFGLASGFNMALRRNVIDAVGGFDEELGAGGSYRAAEDTDIMYRVMRAGWLVACRDDITVVHDDWRTDREEIRTHWSYGVGAGAQTAKHQESGDDQAALIAMSEARKHAYWFVRHLVRLRSGQAALQAAYLSGMVSGYSRYRAGVRNGQPYAG